MDGTLVSDAFASALGRERALSRALLIVNPASRSGSAALAQVRDACAAEGIECHVAFTERAGHATTLVVEQLASSATRPDFVLAIGGDGTAMEVASGLAGLNDAPPLGIVAVGTANVLARTLGIPLSPAAAVRALLAANEVHVDLGRIAGGPAFAIGLGIGLDASMIGGASSAMKRRIGYLAYAFSAIKAGLALEKFRVRLVVDGVSHEMETSSVLVANFGLVLGDLLCFGEQVVHHDGVLDVCVYSPRHLLDAARIFWRMLTGGVSCDRSVRVYSGRDVRIETDPPRPMQADGEMLGLTPVAISVEPHAVRLLVPRTPARRWRLPRRAVVSARFPNTRSS